MKNRNKRVAAVIASKNPAKRLSEILNRLMEECDIDGVRLNKNTGVPTTTINRLRTGDPANNPTLTTLVPLAEFFRITVSQLIGDEALPEDRVVGIHQPSISEWHTIPHLTWEQAARWPEAKNKLEDEVERWTATDLTLGENAFAITMEGDSMYPRFPEGTLFIIDPSQPINNRDFVLILPPGQHKPLFKQILSDGPDYYIKSLNKEFKEIKKISLKDGYKITGVMVQARVEFKK